MSSLKRPLFASLLIVAFIAGSTVGPSVVSAANTAISNVFVTNTASNPVPVAGTVSVGNFPDIQAVSGNVGINGTPSVSVDNFPATQAVSGTVVITGTTEVAYFSSGTLNPAAVVVPVGTDVSAYKSVAVYFGASGLPAATSCVVTGSAPEANGAIFRLRIFTAADDVQTFDPAPPTISVNCLNANGSPVHYSVMVTGRSN